MITRAIFDWAERTPDDVAMIHNGRPFSFRVFAQVIAMARGFFARRACAGPGLAVMAVADHLDFWVFSLALRSLGLTTYAVPDVATIGRLRLPGIRCVVTSSAETWAGLDGMCAERGLRLVSVSLAGELPLRLGPSEEPRQSGGHILRTSGTTGFYKMVLMSPACDALFLRRNAEIYGLDRHSVLCVFDYPPWTGAGYRSPACAWIVGAAALIEQGPELHRAFSRPGITHACVGPEMLAAILAAPADIFPRNEAMKLYIGGGTASRAQVDQVKARITPRFFNWLASTEGGVIACTPLDAPEDRRWHRLISGPVVEIVDEGDRPVPTGQQGRLRVGIAGGPTGYLNDDAATQAHFKDGFFYPGDLAVMRPDGRLALQGRVTDIINVRGVKIYPAPIEDQLGELLGVAGVCLFSMQDEGGEEEIHLVIESPTPVAPDRLTAILRDELREFSHASIHYVTALPRNDIGKLRRQEVRARAVASPSPPVRVDLSAG